MCKVLLVSSSFLGSETNEISTVCSPGEYNLVGFAVGAVERGMKLPQQERIVDRDVLIGVASSGLHSQGFTLVQKILLTSSLHYFSPVPGGCGGQTLGILMHLKEVQEYDPLSRHLISGLFRNPDIFVCEYKY